VPLDTFSRAGGQPRSQTPVAQKPHGRFGQPLGSSGGDETALFVGNDVLRPTLVDCDDRR